MKKFIKKILNLFGIDINRYNPSSNSSNQIVTALKQNNIDLVIDIGANIGQFAGELRSAGFSGKIISFEPLTDARKKLVKAAADDSHWVIHQQCAIGDFNGELVINIAGNSVSSSLLPMLDAHSKAAVNSTYISTEKIKVCKLDSVIENYLKVDQKFFIKIDTQGYEWQVLDGAIKTLNRAQGVLCELSLVPLYQNQRLWRDIVDRLESNGFMLWALQKGFSDPRTGQSLQMDGIFLRK